MGGKIRCKNCGTVLHSMHRHDFRQCSCSNRAFVDGGFDYIRLGAIDMDDVEMLDHEHCPECGKDVEECTCTTRKKGGK